MLAFQSWLLREGYADRTVTQYARSISRMEAWLSDRERPSLRQCKWPEIARYLETLPNTHAARSGIRNALHAYWRYLDRKPPANIRVPGRARMRSKAIEPEQMEKILIAAEAMGLQPHAAVALMYYAGLRRHEVCKARWSDIGVDWMRVLGKGNREDDLPVSPKLAEILDRLPRVSPWIFPSSRRPRTHIADGTLNLWFTALSLATGIDVTPHVVRHTAITEVNDRGGRLSDAQAFARHSDPRVTSGYTRVKQQRLKEAVGLL